MKLERGSDSNLTATALTSRLITHHNCDFSLQHLTLEMIRLTMSITATNRQLSLRVLPDPLDDPTDDIVIEHGSKSYKTATIGHCRRLREPANAAGQS